MTSWCGHYTRYLVVLKGHNDTNGIMSFGDRWDHKIKPQQGCGSDLFDQLHLNYILLSIIKRITLQLHLLKVHICKMCFCVQKSESVLTYNKKENLKKRKKKKSWVYVHHLDHKSNSCMNNGIKSHPLSHTLHGSDSDLWFPCNVRKQRNLNCLVGWLKWEEQGHVGRRQPMGNRHVDLGWPPCSQIPMGSHQSLSI